MGFPTTPTSKIRSRNDMVSVAKFLRTRHSTTTQNHRLDNVMIWNLSEESYDYNEYFDNQVMEVHFPGYPCPPLGLLIRLCISIENWLQSDPKNIAPIIYEYAETKSNENEYFVIADVISDRKIINIIRL